MKSKESTPKQSLERIKKDIELESINHASQERLRSSLEHEIEKGPDASRVEKEAKHEALEKARSGKESLESQRSKERAPSPKRPATKLQKKASYKRTMNEVQSNLSAPSRAFSKFIHNPVVEKTSDFIGGTIARPNAILSGSLFAFALSLGLYIIARYYGYPLSGAETIAAFILGWVIGLIYDYIRLLVGRT